MPATLLRSGCCLAALIYSSAATLTAQTSVAGTVFGSSGQPVAGARVELVPVLSNFEAGRLRLAGGRDSGPVAEGKSDSAGRYLLQAPATGVFKVVVRAEGRLPMQYSPLLLAEDEELPPVSLAVDAGASAVVRDPEGRPLAGAWVFASSSGERREWDANVWRPDFRIGRTGPDGSISLPRLKQERLDVSVFPPAGAELRQAGWAGGAISAVAGGVTARRLRVVSPRGEPMEGVLVRAGDLAWPAGLTDAEGRLRIHLALGGVVRVRLVAPNGQQQIVDLPGRVTDSETVVTLAQPVVVAGRVTDRETGQPLAGALVSPGLDPGAFLFTDAEGRYRLVASEPQGFPLNVHAAGRLPGSVRVTLPHLHAGRAPTLALMRAAALRGVVVDAKGTALGGAMVFALPDSGREPGTTLDYSATDGSGRFELRPLRAGSFYEIRAVRAGYLPASTRAAAPGPSSGVKIVLFPARAARGRVLDAAGRPVSGAEVRLTPARSPGSRRSPEPPAEPAGESSPFVSHADGQGRFLIPQVPAERVDLMVEHRGYAAGHVRGLRIPSGTDPADLGTIILKPGARLQGRVIDRAGKPVIGAQVYLVENVDHLEQDNARLKGETPDAVTGSGGSFILKDLPQGTPLHLLVRASGYLPGGARGVQVPLPKPLILRLEPAATLRGRVIDEQGAPVAGARIVLDWRPTAPENPERQVGAPIERSDLTGRDGRFEIVDSPAGPVRLAVSAQGYLSIEGFETMVPRPDPAEEVTLTLNKGAILTGRIATLGGRPVSGARITVEDASETSDDEGVYTVEGVPLGQAEIQISHPAYELLRREMIIQPGINPLDITVEEGVEVSGRVVDNQGAPVIGARVALLRQVRRDWKEYRERTGADGAFHFPVVARGRYRLEAGGEGYASAERKQPVLVEKESVSGLEIVLRRGGIITGRVLGLDVDQLARVEVNAQAEGREAIPANLDSHGRYEISHLQPGDYLIRAELESGQRYVQARVSLPVDEEVTRDLEFAPRLTLTGNVLYDEEPLPEARISIRGDHLAVERSVWTDFQGRFRFEDLEPDTYWLGLSHSRELLVHNDTIEVIADREITIRLRPSTVSGMVIDKESRRPIPRALIALRSAEGPEFLITDSSLEDGSFSVHRVPAGVYLVTARAGGYSPSEQKLVLPEGQDVAGLEIVLVPTQGLEMTVRLASGRVPDQVHLRALGSAGDVVLTETRPTDPSGKVILSTLPKGSWTLLLSAPGGATTVIPVSVPGDPVAVTLPGAGHLRIRVPALAATDLRATATLSSTGRPFWFVGPGGNLQDAWQVVAGKAMVEGVPAGHWQIRVEAPDGHVWMGQVTTPGQGEVEMALE